MKKHESSISTAVVWQSKLFFVWTRWLAGWWGEVLAALNMLRCYSHWLCAIFWLGWQWGIVAHTKQGSKVESYNFWKAHNFNQNLFGSPLPSRLHGTAEWSAAAVRWQPLSRLAVHFHDLCESLLWHHSAIHRIKYDCRPMIGSCRRLCTQFPFHFTL